MAIRWNTTLIYYSLSTFDCQTTSSTDSGSSWTQVSVPFTDDELVFGGSFNAHALRSLKPGRLMLQTADANNVYLYYSTDHGASWLNTGVVNRTVASRQPGKYLISMQAAQRKYGKDFVYCATHHDAAGKVVMLTYDDFSPSANLIGEETLVSSVATYTPGSTRFNLAAYAERGAPMLQGYKDELEKGAL